MSYPSMLEKKAKRKWVRAIYSGVMWLGSALCLSLGYWQYSKSQTYTQPQPIVLDYQGAYLQPSNWYLDNRTHKGRAGYEVLTVFESESKYYLVNRGFVSYINRDVLPVVETPVEIVEIYASKSKPISPMVLTSENLDPLLNRIQEIRLDQIGQHLAIELEPDVLQQVSGTGLLTPRVAQEPYLNRHKHLAYAAQWWCLALAAIVIWWVSIRAPLISTE